MRRWLVVVALFLVGTAHAASMRIYENVAISPELLAVDQPRVNEGFLDVTRPPYGADPTGVLDASEAIERAIDDGWSNNLVVYFPKGTYLVSRAFHLEQKRVGWSLGQRKFAHILVGDSSGGTYPVIRLVDGATFEDAKLFNFEYTGTHEGYTLRTTRHYNAGFRGLKIDMGANPTKTALSMDGAQFCHIEDVAIVGQFDIGIHGLPGSGGSVTNVRIVGGNIGVLQDVYRPNPSLQGVELLRQEEAAIRIDESRGPVVMTGFRIVGPKDAPAGYRAIRVASLETLPDQHTANLVLVDGTISVSGSEPAIENADQDIYLKNVFARAETIASSGTGTPTILPGDPLEWVHVGEYLFLSPGDGSLAIVDGREASAVGPAAVGPDDDLRARHTWDAATFPGPFADDVIDVVRDYGATRDDESDDDAFPINQALAASVTPDHADFGRPVLLPRGHFHIRSKVFVPAGAKLIGAANTNAVIHVSASWQPVAAEVAVETEDSSIAGTTLSHFAILGQEPSASAGPAGPSHRWITLLKAQSKDMLIRDVQVARTEYLAEARSPVRDAHYQEPVVVFTGEAGGRVYNLALDLATAATSDTMSPEFRTLRIDGTTNPLAFYQLDIEGMNAGPQVEIRAASKVSIYGFKYEGRHQLLEITDSDHVTVVGGSGGYMLASDPAIIRIADTPNHLLANLARRTIGNDPGDYDFIRDLGDAQHSGASYPGTITATGANVGLFRAGSPLTYGESVTID